MNLNLEIYLSCKYKQFAVERQEVFKILTGSLGCLKEIKTMDMILGKCKFPNSFLPYFQYYVVGTH